MIKHEDVVVTEEVTTSVADFTATAQTSTQSEDDKQMTVCDQPPVLGSCTMRLPRYYYDAEQEDCLIFNFSGCDVG